MKATLITVKKDGEKIIISTRNGDWTCSGADAEAIKALVDENEWKEA